MFKPVNRNLLLQPVDLPEKEESKSTILVPNDYKAPTSPYEVYRLAGKATDCTNDFEIEDYVVVESSMVNLLDINGKKFYLVLENYIYATFKEL
jgi:co-chaperonin GroES (HSP10)